MSSLLSGISLLLRPWRKSAEDPSVPLTPDVIRGDLSPLLNVDTSIDSGALYCSAVASAEAFICDAMAAMPIISYDRTSKERAEQNPSYAILKQRPNEFQTPFVFWSTVWRRAIRNGNAYVYPEWNGAGRLANLLLLDNNRVEVKWSNGQKVFLYRGERTYTIPANEMIHLIGFSENGVTGLPLLKYGERAVGLSILAEDYGLKFFSEGEAVSGKYCKVPFSDGKKISAVRAAIQAWKANRHQIPIIPEGGELAGDVPDNQKSQFLELRAFQIAEVARFTRVPPHIIYHYMTGGTYANLEAQSIDLVTNCLQRWITQGEQELTRVVYGPTGSVYAEYLVDARLRGDMLTRMQGYEVAIRAHVMRPNECRRRENLPPIDGGDEFPPIAGAAAQQIKATATPTTNEQQTAQPADPVQDQSQAVASSDLRATVGGSEAIRNLQKDYYSGAIPREAAIGNAKLVFGFSDQEAADLFPEIKPDAPGLDSGKATQ